MRNLMSLLDQVSQRKPVLHTHIMTLLDLNGYNNVQGTMIKKNTRINILGTFYCYKLNNEDDKFKCFIKNTHLLIMSEELTIQ